MERAVCNCCRRTLDVDQLNFGTIDAKFRKHGVHPDDADLVHRDSFSLCKSCLELVKMQLQALSTRICSGFTR